MSEKVQFDSCTTSPLQRVDILNILMYHVLMCSLSQKTFYEALDKVNLEVEQHLMQPGIKKMPTFLAIILQKRPVSEWKINEQTREALHKQEPFPMGTTGNIWRSHGCFEGNVQMLLPSNNHGNAIPSRSHRKWFLLMQYF